MFVGVGSPNPYCPDKSPMNRDQGDSDKPRAGRRDVTRAGRPRPYDFASRFAPFFYMSQSPNPLSPPYQGETLVRGTFETAQRLELLVNVYLFF